MELGARSQRQNTLSAAPISSAEALPNLQGEAALAHLKQRGIYQTIRRQLEAEHYRIRPLPAGGAPVGQAAYQADNHAQQLRADFAPDGLRLSPRQESQGEWQSRMKLIGYGYGAQILPASAARLTAAGNRIEIHHQFPTPDSQPPIVEWYVNTAAGLEHGFDLPAPPGVKTGQEPLRVALALEGELRAEAVEGGQALEFKDDAGQRLLRYDHLVVRDGGGRELEARMAVRMEGGEGEVWLEVDDRDAVWPVTIDPTFTQQQKLEASDAAADDFFGNSVAISGETVVVGAPLMMAQRASIKARPMSLCVAAESGASSRSWRPRTRRQLTNSAHRWRSQGRRSWSARSLMMAQRASIKARPMSLCVAAESGASSRSSRPRTRRQMTVSATRWRSQGRRSWSARRVMMAQRASIKARPMSLCVAAESGASSRSSWPRTRRQMTTSALGGDLRGDGRGRRAVG